MNGTDIASDVDVRYFGTFKFGKVSGIVAQAFMLLGHVYSGVGKVIARMVALEIGSPSPFFQPNLNDQH